MTNPEYQKATTKVDKARKHFRDTVAERDKLIVSIAPEYTIRELCELFTLHFSTISHILKQNDAYSKGHTRGTRKKKKLSTNVK